MVNNMIKDSYYTRDFKCTRIVQFQEMDTPHNLLQNLDSHLSKLAKNAGESAYHELKEMAASNASKRKQL